jgi:5-hydroxyisourate hydrolase-like protein (transthyretin family)
VTLEILVLDEASGEPVQNAQVRYRSLASEKRELSAGDTDEAGIAAKDLAPGEYRFTVKKNGYREVTQDFSVTANGKNQLIIKMQAL